MGLLSIKDVVALAKAGYSVKDVKELMQIEAEEPKDTPKEEPKDTPKDIEEPKEEPKAIEEPKDVKPDYEKLYNELIKKNNRANIAGNEKSEDELISDLVRDFM